MDPGLPPHVHYADEEEQLGPGTGVTGPHQGAGTDTKPLTSAALSPTRRALGPLLTLLLLVNLSTSLYQLPLNRVIERRLCKEYYVRHVEDDSRLSGPDGQIREELCKLNEIQEGLAKYQQAMDMAWMLGDLVMTIPLGFVAEKYGRRTVLLLNLVPRVAMLSWAVVVGYLDDWIPINAIVLAPMLSFLGGDCVFNSITYALAAGITDDNVLRASYFGYMSSISYVVALLGPTLASATMSIIIWLPFWIGISLLLLSIRAVSKLPSDLEPIHQSGLAADSAHSGPHGDGHGQDQDQDQDQYGAPDDPLVPSLTTLKNPHQAFDAKLPPLQAIKQRFLTLYHIVVSQPRNFPLLLASMFLTSLASADTKLLVQYISKRYHWTFAEAGYLLSCKAVVNFVLLTALIPAVLRARDHRRRQQQRQWRLGGAGGGGESRTSSVERTNRHDAVVCLVISVLGAFLIGLGGIIWVFIPSLLLYALGSALPVFTYSLLKSPQVSPSPHSAHGDGHGRRHQPALHPAYDAEVHDTTIFSIVMLVKAVGSLVGVPIVTSMWIKGIELVPIEDRWLGLPYFVSSACYLAAIVVISFIKVD